MIFYEKNFRIAIAIALFGSLLVGYTTGVISGAGSVLAVPGQFNMDIIHQSFLLTIIMLQFSAALGSLLAGFFCDKYGRKRILLFMAGLFLIAIVLSILAKTVSLVLISRCVLGLAIGGTSVVTLLYLTEISPTRNRGKTVTRHFMLMAIGQLMALVFNALIVMYSGSTTTSWHYTLAVAIVLAIIFIIALLKLPESFRFLASKNCIEEATATLNNLHSELQTKLTLDRITENKDKPVKFTKLLLVGLGLVCVNQITGINTVLFYVTQLLKSFAFTDEAILAGNIANSIVCIFSLYVGLVMMDFFRRKTILLSGLSGITVVLILMSFILHILPENIVLLDIMLAFSLAYVVFFYACIFSVTYLIICEIFPQASRGLAVGLIVAILWLFNFVTTFVLPVLVFPAILKVIGVENIFVIFAILSVLSLLFVYKVVPETKFIFLEDLEQKLNE